MEVHTNLPEDFRFSQLPAAAPQALRASSLFREALFRAAFLDDGDCFLQLLHRDIEGGQEAELVLGLDDQHALFTAGCNDIGRVFLRLDAEHQAEAGHTEHALRAGQFLFDIRRAFFYAFKHLLVQTAQDVDCACAADGVAAEGRAVRSGGKHILHLFAQQRRAERQAARKALGRGDDIGLHAVVHIAVQLSAAAIADLHLVADEKQIILFAQLRRALDIRLVQRRGH